MKGRVRRAGPEAGNRAERPHSSTPGPCPCGMPLGEWPSACTGGGTDGVWNGIGGLLRAGHAHTRTNARRGTHTHRYSVSRMRTRACIHGCITTRTGIQREGTNHQQQNDRLQGDCEAKPAHTTAVTHDYTHIQHIHTRARALALARTHTHTHTRARTRTRARALARSLAQTHTHT